MKPIFKTLGLALIGSWLISSNSLAQFIYPPASIFNPTANTYRGSGINALQWLEANDAQVLAFLLSVNNLDSELNGSQKPVTLLVPTDKAFGELPINVRQQLSEPAAMQRLLKYHLVAGVISEADIKNQQVNTLEGSPVKITANNTPLGVVETKLNEAILETSIGLNNNLVLILIDKVLLPPNF